MESIITILYFEALVFFLPLFLFIPSYHAFWISAIFLAIKPSTCYCCCVSISHYFRSCIVIFSDYVDLIPVYCFYLSFFCFSTILATLTYFYFHIFHSWIFCCFGQPSIPLIFTSFYEWFHSYMFSCTHFYLVIFLPRDLRGGRHPGGGCIAITGDLIS